MGSLSPVILHITLGGGGEGRLADKIPSFRTCQAPFWHGGNQGPGWSRSLPSGSLCSKGAGRTMPVLWKHRREREVWERTGDQGHGGDFREDCSWGRRLEDKVLGQEKGTQWVSRGSAGGRVRTPACALGRAGPGSRPRAAGTPGSGCARLWVRLGVVLLDSCEGRGGVTSDRQVSRLST